MNSYAPFALLFFYILSILLISEGCISIYTGPNKIHIHNMTCNCSNLMYLNNTYNPDDIYRHICIICLNHTRITCHKYSISQIIHKYNICNTHPYVHGYIKRNKLYIDYTYIKGASYLSCGIMLHIITIIMMTIFCITNFIPIHIYDYIVKHIFI